MTEHNSCLLQHFMLQEAGISKTIQSNIPAHVYWVAAVLIPYIVRTSCWEVLTLLTSKNNSSYILAPFLPKPIDIVNTLPLYITELWTQTFRSQTLELNRGGQADGWMKKYCITALTN